MSKDPAFLLYPQDFLVGTMTMNNEQVGKYVRLLCFQHQAGHLLEDDMLDIAGDKDVKIWRKFKQDSEGLYYNERLETETIKRRKYSESRANNRTKKNNICKTYEPHMENVNETEIVNEDNNGIPPLSDFVMYALAKKPKVNIEQVKLKYESWTVNGWKDGNDKEIKNWKTKLLNTLPHLKESEIIQRKPKW